MLTYLITIAVILIVIAAIRDYKCYRRRKKRLDSGEVVDLT